MLKQFERLPKQGQILLYIDCSYLTARSIADALILVKGMNYQPELRYAETKQGIEMFILLKDEQITSDMPRDYLADEWEALVEAFLPDDMAVRNPRSVPQLAVAA